MDESQRLIVGAKLANLSAGDNQHGPANWRDQPPISQADAASMLNVSERGISRAKKVLKDAPELAPIITAGNLFVSAASELAKLPADERGAIAAAGAVRA